MRVLEKWFGSGQWSATRSEETVLCNYFHYYHLCLKILSWFFGLAANNFQCSQNIKHKFTEWSEWNWILPSIRVAGFYFDRAGWTTAIKLGNTQNWHGESRNWPKTRQIASWSGISCVWKSLRSRRLASDTTKKPVVYQPISWKPGMGWFEPCE